LVQKRLALGVVLFLAVAFLIIAGPLSTLQLPRIPAFIPAYATAMFVIDSITASLLFTHFSILRSRALLVLASGYLFNALIVVPWMLTFPGVFAPSGLLGAGLQSTNALYLLWHAGFPTFVIAYALLKDGDPTQRLWQGSARAAILSSIAITAAIVGAAAILVTAGHDLLPALMADTVHLSTGWFFAAGIESLLMVLAIVVLWVRRRSTLDLWLMVVMWAFAIEIALISFPVAARYTVGWYGGRICGALSGSLLLFVLLYEITLLYGRRAEDRLREQARLLDLTHDTIFVRNMTDAITYWNRGAEDLYGWTREEALGKLSHQLLQTIFPAPLEEISAELLRTGRWDGELVHTRADGTQVVVASRWALQSGAQGNPLAILETNNDITASKRAAEAQLRLGAIVASSDDAIISKTLGGIITSWNAGAQRIFGYAAEEACGQPINILIPPDRQYEESDIIERIRRAESVRHFETVRIRKDGGQVHVSLAISPIKDAAGQIIGASKIARDITERKLAEAEHARLGERLREAEKMEAIGRLAGGIAHDFNNVLGGILAYGEMLFEEAPADSARRRHAHNVLTAATRGRALIQQILAYSRSQRGKSTPTDVCRAVAETLELVQGSLPANILLEASAPNLPLVVIGDATQLHQVVMNLCSNAIQAMSAGGTLRAALETAARSAEEALSHGTLRSGRYVRLTVEDSGCGMDEATLARIFEPFFTTKNVGRGTGLGLALVYAIVTDLGGAIDVKSTPNQGSTFAIYLPLADVPCPTVTA
jgi:PAS domain S-box-containing protein